MIAASLLAETMHDPTTGGGARAFVDEIDDDLHAHRSPRYWDWLRMYEADPLASPLQHPDVALGDVRHAPAFQAPSAVIGIERRGECQALAILTGKVVSTRRIGGIGPAATLTGCRLIGNRGLQPHDNPHVTGELVGALLQYVAQSRADFLLIDHLDDDSPLDRALAKRLPAGWMTYRHTGTQPRRLIQLPATPQEYWGRFSSKTRSTFRRKLKKFGDTRLERITEPAQVAGFLEAAHAISRQTWQTRQFGLRVRNNRQELDQFTALAGLGMLRSYLWYVNDEPVAFTIGHQDKGRFHYEEVGYATAQARYSPGQMMLLQMIDDLIQHNRPQWFDFGAGDADYKRLFATHEVQSGTVWLFPPSVRNGWLVPYLHGCQTMRRTARRCIDRLGLVSRFRQWVRYGTAKTMSSPPSDALPPLSDDPR